MVWLPSRVSFKKWSRVGHYIKVHLNFFRVHVLFFTFTPLIFSAILYASNGQHPLSYTDALFNSVSAITVCGLATVDLSGLTPWQQFLLFFQMSIGNPVIVSWVMVYIRRHFFKQKFTNIVQAELSRRAAEKLHAPVEVKVVPWWKRTLYLLIGRSPTRDSDHSERPGSATPPRVRPDMIRRMDDAPKLVNPSGWISEGARPNTSREPNPPPNVVVQHPDTPSESGESSHPQYFDRIPSISVSEETESAKDDELNGGKHRDSQESSSDSKITHRLSASSNGGSEPRVSPSTSDDSLAPQQARRGMINRTLTLPRTQTVEFAPTPRRRPISHERDRGDRLPSINDSHQIRSMERFPTLPDRRSMSRPTMSIPYTTASRAPTQARTKHRGFGGFPMPLEILSAIFHWLFPRLERQLTRTVTIPRTQTIASQAGPGAPPGARLVPYISFEAVVGRNSRFHQLTKEQLDELGGVEYRSLTALLWIVGAYHIALQLIAFTVIAPYMSMSRWQDAFRPPTLLRNLSPVWFSLFQVISSYTNTGMSLEDRSMLPFQRAYPMIIFMIILILAGNTAFPIFLRFTIWVLSKLVSKQSRLNETLQFLLDHPRRCFVYLFPSHQTWFLLTVLVVLNATDWFFFLVLDLGTQVIQAIPVGLRILLGLLQAAAVRAAGFASVPLAALAPGVKVLYVIMMYISVYPIAMSVRSTNVYEEKSLGVFDDESSLSEEGFNATGNRATVWSRYLTMHMRKQLSFDMWWLAVALFLVCIIERDGLDDEANNNWFTIFTILFELVSAYGTVGLSLGVPYANYSFSGALRPLSKLIICLVMLRGRHRGLPVAIDRAIMLPFEFQETADEPVLPDETEENGEPLQNGEAIPNGDMAREKSAPPDLPQRYPRHTWTLDTQEMRDMPLSRRTNTVTIEEP
ncbi:unnamed protein product [Somion occarium]|uniref:Potassium transport protein n=1 Tax=Somion occarium TaxID=3059160 RepID=A0ABP1DUN2_9APHY